ncbi:MAG: hypothetical protein ACE5JS_17795 [Nitrospinota bacterium]
MRDKAYIEKTVLPPRLGDAKLDPVQGRVSLPARIYGENDAGAYGDAPLH